MTNGKKKQPFRKIINDPVHGFITIDDPAIFDIISHPYYQRLRRIRQMALAPLVYPGAVHTRLLHSLGAYHLMCRAIDELIDKRVEISREEQFAVKAAILLHDIGHGPFSHALEHSLIKGISHEEISLKIMQFLNREMGGKLDLAIKIFANQYHKPFLHQLISGQVDMDRLDYLSRDTYFTGVSEGVIGYDRILQMLAVQDNQLMIEEKGIYSIEKFLISRRQMYWQVYMHKTVLAAEKMLVKIMLRANELYSNGDKNLAIGSNLDFFLGGFSGELHDKELELFCQLDDNDIIFAVKKWSQHPDPVLSILSRNLLTRKLLKCIIQKDPIDAEVAASKRQELKKATGLPDEMLSYFIFTGKATNTIYKQTDESIKILFKNGKVKDISEVDNALISDTISAPVEKYYICYPKKEQIAHLTY
ncbi:MAG: phosphohydrolase [Pseudopedobacter saltans]|uniref:Phosphohydrolase n=1 Tax=Pseudopedobacter saltans TaxID=151895 RepID=A0A2W5F6X9_9SPHI|nr:MAG: phosphohydrolase [Pseudopedobacter saltans]